MDQVKPEKILKEEEEFIAAAYELSHAITDEDPDIQDMRWQIIKHPGDQITYRRYYRKKAELIREFTKVYFSPGGETNE